MANRLWAEVYTPDDVMQGIVSVASVQINRRLDSAGDFVMRVPTSDSNVVNLLTVWRRVRIYWEHPLKGKTYIGGGVLLSRQFNEAAGSLDTAWTGMDDLHELKRENTLRGLIYDDTSIEAVVDDLVANVAGWSASVEAGLGDTSRRFDGQSILGAVIATATGGGYHMRLKGDRLVEVGAFGDAIDLRITNAGQYAVASAPNVAFIERLGIITDGNEIVNWIEPVWGNGDAVLTLKRSTRTSPYTIQTITGPNGRTVYYLSDSGSIASYGAVKKVISMTDAPYIAADGSGKINAANVLYDWAAAELARYAEPQVVYQVAGIKLDRSVLPGQKVRVAYRGEVLRDGVKVRYAEIDDVLWVIGVIETYDNNGQRWTLDVSNVDRQPEDDIELIANSLVQQKQDKIAVKLTGTTSRYTTTGTLSGGSPVELVFEIPEITVDVGQALVRVTRDSGDCTVVSAFIDGVEIIGGQLWTTGETTFSAFFDDLLADGTIQGSHTIRIECLYGSGDVSVSAEVVEITPGV